LQIYSFFEKVKEKGDIFPQNGEKFPKLAKKIPKIGNYS